MIQGVRVKLCGITSLVDAEAAMGIGVDYLGFNLYPKSPRFVTREQAAALMSKIDGPKKVGLLVEPTMDDLSAWKDFGFDYLQLHFSNDTPFFEVAMWTDIVPCDRLWLAPRVPPGKDIDMAFLPMGDHILVDAFKEGAYGGTGLTANWTEFARLKALHQKAKWVLAGGLSPDNIGEALKTSQADIIDVNSGVEVSPGVKDAAKLQALAAAIRQARGG
jgi:phosphoribosylanthranilate isomerase